MRIRQGCGCWIIACAALLAVAFGPVSRGLAQTPPTLAGCPVLPANNIWNTPIDKLPVDPNSASYTVSIGTSKGLHPDFGSGIWNGGPIGIPYNVVPETQPTVPISFDYSDESDPGPYPIPPDPAIEGGSQASGDRHVLVIDRDHCLLYETWSTYPNADGSWQAGSGAVFDLRSNDLRPSTWTSSDAAGLPVLAGLVRYEEVAAGEINHAIRFTAPQTRKEFIWPARHHASNLTDEKYPPMGQRFRLKASFNISGFAPEVQVILQALKKFGMILADNGSSWYLSGVPDPRWNDDILVSQLRLVKGSDFEAIDESSLMLDPNSGEVISDRPIISVAPGSHHFPGQSVGEISAAQPFTIANAGQSLLVLGTVAITGRNRAEFLESFDGCSDQTLAPSDNCTELIAFAPQMAGAKRAALNISSSDPLKPEVKVPLSGTAIEPVAITLVSPNGAENWEPGSTQTIQWQFTGKPGMFVEIQLLKGDIRVRTICSKAPIGDDGYGSYSWLIPEKMSSGADYRIKISTLRNAMSADMSDKGFTITAPPVPTISLIIPNGGENWQRGTTQTIQWGCTGNPGPYVRLQLLREAGVIRTITRKTASGDNMVGTFNWRIPATLSPGGAYRVRITSMSNASSQDESSGSFTIYQ